MDVECKWSGSVHNATIFANSTAYKNMRTSNLPQIFYNILPGHESIPNGIIDDPAYPLTPYCMKEFQYCIEKKHVIFNNMPRGTRNQIECAFGRLKARWRFFKKAVDLKFEFFPTVMCACFVLHNYCENQKKCGIDEEEVQDQVLRYRANEDGRINQPDPSYSCNTDEREYIRNVLTNYIQEKNSNNIL